MLYTPTKVNEISEFPNRSPGSYPRIFRDAYHPCGKHPNDNHPDNDP